jgi:excisionase family DNA binding protein
MTPEEVADYLRLNRETVYRNLRRGQLPGIKVGSQWRVSRSSLNKALEPFGLHKESPPENPDSSSPPPHSDPLCKSSDPLSKQ